MAVCMPAPAADPDVAATIIAMERAALDRWDAGDPKGFLEITDPQIVYFDPGQDKPIEGLPALRAYYGSGSPSSNVIHGVMSNAKVQIFDHVVILSFHYVSQPGAKKEKFWNCTETYRNTNAGWHIVNTHWSLTKPLLQPFE